MVAYHYDVMTLAPNRAEGEPEKYPCPQALALNRQLGDYHLITPGGLWDQPVGAWQAQQYAGWIWYILEAERTANEASPVDKTLKPHELALLWKTIHPIQEDLATHGQ